jgi:hypothetical protein
MHAHKIAIVKPQKKRPLYRDPGIDGRILNWILRKWNWL